MSETELMDTTPYAFNRKVEGWMKTQKRIERSEWERTRWLAVMCMNPHLKKPLKPTDLFKFDDESKASKVVDPVVDEKANRISKKWRPE